MTKTTSIATQTSTSTAAAGTSTSTKSAATSVSPCMIFKYVYSMVLLIFSIVIIMALIFQRQTRLAANVHPILALLCMWGAIIWLTMVEGGQASLVGLTPVNADLCYRETHTIAYRCAKIVHKGDNLDRYLMGRQFMVVLIVFVVNLSGSPIDDAELWGLPNIFTNIFINSGVAMILLTTMIGQLNSQVNASHCMLDYLNTWPNYVTIVVARFIEASGLVHASYLIQIVVAAMAGKPVESKESPRTDLQNIFFFGKCFMSLGILIFAFVVTLVALFNGQTTMWEGVPGVIAVILFFILMGIVGLLEGMQIAFFAVAKLTKEERGTSPIAMKTCELLFRGQGRNLPGFMVGRQICVVSCMFIVARITSLHIDDDEENVFGVSDGVQAFFDTGLLGALITTIVGSITWQLVASAFPLAFLSNPLVYIFLRLCLLLESTGVCAGAWVLASFHRSVAGFQRDEVYIGTAEERKAKAQRYEASKKKNNNNTNGRQLGKDTIDDDEYDGEESDYDDDDFPPIGPGHPIKLPAFIEVAPDSLKELISKDPSVIYYIDTIRKVDSQKEYDDYGSTDENEEEEEEEDDDDEDDEDDNVFNYRHYSNDDDIELGEGREVVYEYEVDDDSSSH